LATNEAELVERITRQVVTALLAQGGGLACVECGADGCRCVERHPERVRAMLDAGASRIGGRPGARPPDRALARTIDHTLLKPDATPHQVEQLCVEARDNHFASVCVNASFVPLCARLLRGTDVAVCTVVGFPLGATTTETKAFEARQAIRNGAREIDMVLAIGRLKAGEHDYVRQDIARVVETAHDGAALCKVILETALLTDEEKVVACTLAVRAKADFVKTSTGFASGGATVHDVMLMRTAVGDAAGVKASGGVKGLADAQAMIVAGATRIGASAGVRIVAEARGGTGSGGTAEGGKQTY
jgi:deoxyribose-phosphate aldolase